MSEYIERDKLIDDLTQLAKYQTGERQQAILGVIETVRLRKAADVEPVRHGRWKTNSDRPDTLICSVCKRGFDMWKHDPHNFCPNCGAKMDGGMNNGD